MKKIFLILGLSLLLVTGCGNSMNTPTGAVEDFLSKYQNLDSEVLTQLDSVVSGDKTMSDEQKESYRDLMVNQYRNLSYKVVDETVMEDEAEVEVEIEVLDYATNINESRIYFKKHLDEFESDKKEEDIGDTIDDIASFIEYKIKNMKGVTNTATQNITFYLTKDGKDWKVEDLSESDVQKLHGLYEG